jgi:uncharacterized membrane-anchored protein YhcB (DUF1043 family)
VAAMTVTFAMYFVIGLLVGVTIGLLFVPLAHDRGVRLTKRRLQAAMPLKMTELGADRDLQRAEFAMSIRRLEVVVDDLRSKHAAQLAELGKKSDAIGRMKEELIERKAEISALEAREKELLGRVRLAQEELLDLQSLSLTQLDRAVAERKSRLNGFNGSMMDDLDVSAV